MQTRTKQIIRVLFLAWLFVTLFVSNNSASAYTASILSAGSVTINLDGTAETATTTSDLTINTTCPAGYIVQVSGTNASNNHNLYLNGNSSNDTTVIFNSAGTVSSPITLADNTWGIQVGVNTYTGISNSPQDFSIGTSGSYVAGEDITLPVTYGARNGGSLMSGTYTMDSGNVLYTLVMDGTCIPYTITYDGNTATTGTMDTTTYKHEFTPGTTTSFDLYASNFSKTGYGFVGWGTRPLVASTAAELNTAVTNETITIYGPNETITAPSYFDLLPRSSGNKKLYAVWLASQGNLQGWAGCSSMSIGDVTALTDTRDNNTYAIAKLADGNCWMIENSRLDPAGMTLNKTNTNHANQEFIEYVSSLSNSTFNTCSTADNNYECIEQYSVGMGNVTGLTANALNGDQSTRWYSYGAMYNWFTATAYTVLDAYSQMPSENYISVPGDICPVGWHLPYGGSDSGTKGGNTSGGFYYLGTELEATVSNAASSNIWRSFPNNFIYSGSYDEALVQDRGLSGYYWSPTTTMDGSIFFFNLEGSDVSVAGALDALDSNAGFAIRCVASMPETFTLSYDANGGTGTPASQTTTGNGIASFTISNITPTRSGYTFAGWSDVDGQAIQAGETYSATETTATLFAKWNNNSCNPSATTIGTGNTSTDAVCLQDINSTIRGTMNIATTSTGTYTLIDARDNKTYTIAKLDDGNIWLTQNLDFAPSVDIFIAANDSDVPGFLVPAASNEFITDDQSYDDSFLITPKVMSDSTYGGYYSFAAAIASTTAYRDRQIITTSICPKGWDLPTVDHFDILGDYVQDPNVMINVPYSFTLPGYRWGTEFYNQGDGFYYWSSTNQDGWNDGFGNYKLQGEAVRCIASNGTGTIHYYANGGTGTMPDQTVEINAGQAKFNEFTAPEHTQFMEWNTEADGSGTPVEEGQSIIGSGLVEGGSISLYAQWQHSYLINYNINGGDEGVMNNITEFSEGESVTFIASNFSRPNYGFAGWSTNPNAQPGDGISTIYGPNETITTDSSFLANADSNYNIIMYAIWVQSEDNLQGWTGCSSMNAGDVTALTDTRDNNSYAVAKLADGNCWMIENLRLDLSANGEDIAAYNTNHPTIAFVSEAHAMQGSTSTWDTCSSSVDSDCYNHISFSVSDINRNYTASYNATSQTSQWYSYGAHYNWYTATAGNGVYSTGTNTTVSGDICPVGWFLPYGNTTTDTGNRSGGFSYLDRQLGGNGMNQYTSVATNRWRKYPNNFIYSGYLDPGTNGRGIYGNYWSSTSSNNSNYSYTMLLSSNNLYMASPYFKNQGLTIRCIAKNTLDTITLTYNANGGTGAPNTSQTATGNGVADFTVSSVVPTRSGFTFNGWGDKNGQIVQPGDIYHAIDTNAVLYALWTNNTCNPTATTIGTNTSTDAVCLQDMNSTIKSTMNVATTSTGTYTLKDARDNQEYTIAKLVDGNVWMTKNLNFAPSTDMLITSADSDVTIFVFPASTTTFETSNDITAYVNPKVLANSTYGGYYSYAAAIASTTAYSANGQNISTSICPKGWDLPTSSQFNNLKTVANLTNYTAAHANPYKFNYAGYKSGNNIFSQTSVIRLWTSTNYSSPYAYYTTGYGNAAYSGNYKYYGESVRCIMSLGRVTISFDANDSSAYPATGSVSAQNNVEIMTSKLPTISSSVYSSSPFNRPGYVLKSWSKTAGAVYGDGNPTFASGADLSTTGVIDGDNVTFYAVWNPIYTITYIDNCSTIIENCNGDSNSFNNYIESGTTNSIAPNTSFTHTGYKIKEWNTSPDGTGTSYATNSDYNPGTIIIPTDGPTLYAIWARTYDIIYDGNNSTSGTMTQTHTNVVEGDTVELYASNFSRTGYGFAGWSTNPNAQPGDGVSTIYGPNETITAPARPASGTLTLYAVWVEAEKVNNNPVSMQNWTGCSSLGIGDVIALTDSRDNNVYTVAKLADGNCWMIENLRLDPAGKTFNNTNTNNPASDFSTTVAGLSSSSFATCTNTSSSCVEQYSAGMGNITGSTSSRDSEGQNYRWYSYGGMYNWYTATAGNGTYESESAVGGDICPAGWHLPYGGNETSIDGGRTSGGFSYLNDNIISNDSNAAWRSYPNNFIYSGDYYSSTSRERGESGVYWSSTPNSNHIYAYYLRVSIYGVDGFSSYDSTHWNRYNGYAVRCVLGLPKIIYDGNGADGGTMPTYSHIATGSTTELSAPNYSRTGYGFAGWSTNPSAQPGDGVSTIYGPNETITVPAYGNSDTLTLYAVWVQSTGNLQNWAGCSSMSAGAVTALTDARDNNTYAVARLADGNCWMVENLRLDPAGKTLDSSNTNNPTSGFSTTVAGLSSSSFATCASSNSACIDQYSVGMGNVTGTKSSRDSAGQNYRWYSYGGMYNWYTATAGNGTYSMGNYSAVTGSICPAGWHLPYGGSATDTNGGNTSGGFYYLGNQLGATVSNATSSNIWRSYPNNFIYSGTYNGSTSSQRGKAGSYWSATTYYNTSYSYYLELTSSSLVPHSSYYKYTGKAIRCISDYIQFTLTYSANAGEDAVSNLPIAQTYSTNSGSATFIISSTIPSRSGYYFLEWNTAADGSGDSYFAGDTYTTNSTNATLYARWTDCPPEYICYSQSMFNVDGTMDNQAANSYSEITLHASNYAHTAYGFAGWKAKVDGGGTIIYGPNQTITTGDLSSHGMTLYAEWGYGGGSSNMQGWKGCSSMSSGAIITLNDVRDGNNYVVAKLADGNCWMIENLRFNPAGKTLTDVNTNHPDPAFAAAVLNLSNSSFATCTSSDSACIDQYSLGLGNVTGSISDFTNGNQSTRWHSYGGMYNWYTATAGNGTYNTYGDVITGDICPKGWHLPYGGNGSNAFGGNTSGGFYYLASQLGATSDDVNSSKILRSYPNNFILSGKYYGSDASDRGNYGFYHSSTSWSNINPYYMLLHENGVNPGTTNGGGKQYGFAVRCVSNQSYTIVYDGNGADEGSMTVTHTGVLEGDDVRLYASNYSRAGYGFAGWSTNPNAQPGDGISTIYGPNQTITAPAYNGTSTTTTLYAIWVQSTGNMQGWNGCSSMSSGAVTALTDTRDSSTYAVAKLADGNCWMIENLRLDLSTNGDDITIYNTNRPTLNFIDEANNMTGNTSTWNTCIDSSASCVNQISFFVGDMDRNNTASPNTNNQVSQWYSYGAHYNWYTATAGNGMYDAMTNDTIAAGDICPIGWGLPYAGISTNLYGGNTSGGFKYLTSQLGITSMYDVNSSKILRSYPNNFIYSGNYVGSSANRRGSSGSYWSSTYDSHNDSYGIIVNEDNPYWGNNSNSMYHGFAIRCRAGEYYTISFDANAGTDTVTDLPSSQTRLLTPGNTVFAVPSTAPTRSGYTFNGWNTAADGSGTSHAAGSIYTASQTTSILYAQWS